jgi:hypothetical protein
MEEHTGLMMGNLPERLGEDVCKVVGGWNMFNNDIPFIYSFTDVVVLNIDVFDTSIVFCVFHKRYHTHIICVR